MPKLVSFLTLVCMALILSPPAATQNKLKPHRLRKEPRAAPEAPDQDRLKEKLGDLEEQLAKLRREERRLEREMDRLRHEKPGLEPREEREPLRWPRPFGWRRFWPPSFGLRFRDLDEHLRDLEDYFRRFEDRFRDLQKLPPFGTKGSGISISVRQTDEGVRVEVRKRSPGENESVEVYEARSPQAFEEKYPEVVKKYGIHFGPDGTFRLHLGPEFDLRQRFAPWFDRFRDWPLEPFPALRRDRLGVRVAPVPEKRSKALDLETGEGLVVREVEPDSLAERLGIQEDDVLVSINGRTVRGADTIRRALRRTRGHETVTVEVDRPGQGPLTLKARKAPGLKKIL